VTILGRDGRAIRRIKTQGSMPTNLCFGPKGERTIYVTEVETGSVQVFDVNTDGYPLNL
jgi:sugar lactone lactonase YvrE